MELVKQYKYLGLIFTEFLDLLTMAKTVAKSASRALGLLISKDKAFGGMPLSATQDAMMLWFRLQLTTVQAYGELWFTLVLKLFKIELCDIF